MIEVNCDLCGHNDYQVLFEKDEFWAKRGTWVIRDADNKILNGRNVYCNNCGLIYLNPRMTKEELVEFYENDYRNTMKAQKNDRGDHPVEEDFSGSVLLALYTREFILRHNILKPKSKVLDVGCHVGSLLAQLKNLGCETFGVEPDKRYSEYSTKLWGIDSVTQCTIEDYPDTEKDFDLITITDCLEHTPSITDALNKIHSLLKPGGHVVIDIPSWERPNSTIPGFLSSAHIYTFHPRNIRAYLKKTGFKPITIDYSGHAGSTHVLAEAIEKDNETPLEFESPENFWQVHNYLENFQRMYEDMKMLHEIPHLINSKGKSAAWETFLVERIMRYENFKGISSMLLAEYFRFRRNQSNEIVLLNRSLQFDDATTLYHNRFISSVRLAELHQHDAKAVRNYLEIAEQARISIEDVVWPNDSKTKNGFAKKFPYFELFDLLMKKYKLQFSPKDNVAGQSVEAS